MLKVENLSVHFNDDINNGDVVSDVSFVMNTGEILAIVGESGSGKSMTALSIIGLLKKHAHISGKIILDDVELNGLSKNERHDYMGDRISMIFQEPMTSLNPVMKIGRQVEEMLILHGDADMSANDRREKVITALADVDLPEPDKLYDKYPHELSGGMRQRVMIAIATICRPDILIADEPTTALDIQTQEQILELIKKIHTDKMSVLIISHDLNVVAELADRIIVMNKGKIVESGTTEEILNHPQKEYTKKLIDSVPKGKKESNISDVNDENIRNVIIKAKDLSIYYKVKNQKKYVIEHLNFEIFSGEILGLVGRSGLGKTTISKTILGIHKYYDGEIINKADKCQMIFQDPFSSLNPAKTIGWILEEPLRIEGIREKLKRREKVIDMLYKVGLDESYYDRKPKELSGGQRQRVSIATALIGGARFIIADEPVSALDVTIQAQILDLLLELQKETGITMLFISHDIHVIEKMCDRILKIE